MVPRRSSEKKLQQYYFTHHLLAARHADGLAIKEFDLSLRLNMAGLCKADNRQQQTDQQTNNVEK